MQVKELILSPEEAFDEAHLFRTLYQKLSIPPDGELVVQPIKRSIDARGREIKVRMQYEVLTIVLEKVVPVLTLMVNSTRDQRKEVMYSASRRY